MCISLESHKGSLVVRELGLTHVYLLVKVQGFVSRAFIESLDRDNPVVWWTRGRLRFVFYTDFFTLYSEHGRYNFHEVGPIVFMFLRIIKNHKQSLGGGK